MNVDADSAESAEHSASDVCFCPSPQQQALRVRPSLEYELAQITSNELAFQGAFEPFTSALRMFVRHNYGDGLTVSRVRSEPNRSLLPRGPGVPVLPICYQPEDERSGDQ